VGRGIFASTLIALLPACWGQERTVTDALLYRADVDLLPVADRITDRHDNVVHELTADRFRLYEDGVLQKISFFAKTTNRSAWESC
jgi:hypothetical protein